MPATIPANNMTDESMQGGGKPKTNRLRRSPKQTQATPSLVDSPKTCQGQ